MAIYKTFAGLTRVEELVLDTYSNINIILIILRSSTASFIGAKIIKAHSSQYYIQVYYFFLTTEK